MRQLGLLAACLVLAVIAVSPTADALSNRRGCGTLESAWLVETTAKVSCLTARRIGGSALSSRHRYPRFGSWDCRPGRFPVLHICDLDYGSNISYGTVWVVQVVE